MEIIEQNTERRAVLCAIHSQGQEASCLRSLDELKSLLHTAGGEAVAYVTQMKDNPDNAFYFGTGKLKEIKELAENLEADLIIVDDELSPLQIRNMEETIEMDVIDRSILILDIFALHASSAEGRLQVELAQLKYTAPRLTGKGKDMSRLGGGIGTRGPGETKLEIDRRRAKEKISILEERLKNLEKNREVIRKNRDRNGLKKCAIVGYTNAGKSTLLNYLTNAKVLAEDKLFATLDPTTRMLTLPDDSQVFLTDTVGFIHKLPHHLIKAFKSTLDEAVLSDILIILCDASDPNFLSELQVTEELMIQLGAKEKPTIYAFNKCDQIPDNNTLSMIRESVQGTGKNVCFLSAKTGAGVPYLLEQLTDLVHKGKQRCTYSIPFSDASVLSLLYASADDVHSEYRESDIGVDALVDEKIFNQFKKYFHHFGYIGDDV